MPTAGTNLRSIILGRDIYKLHRKSMMHWLRCKDIYSLTTIDRVRPHMKVVRKNTLGLESSWR